MVTADLRTGLARAIRDAHAVDCGIPMVEPEWSDLVGTVEEWHPEADAALAYLAARPAVDVEAVEAAALHLWDLGIPVDPAALTPDVAVVKCRWCNRCQECGDYRPHTLHITPDVTR